MIPSTLSAVVPSYQRPDWMQGAVRSLLRQVPPPCEVIIVARHDDFPTHEAVRSLQSAALPIPLRLETVSRPGFMPPVATGIERAVGEAIAFMDDDATAEPGWVAGLLRAYDDPAVGAAGGRCINMDGDQMARVPSTRRVGYVSSSGRFVGNMYMQPSFANAVDVDFLMGGCMSYRADVARSLEFDWFLNQNAATGYEIDLGLQVRARGLRIRFDPAVAIKHYSAPRALVGNRAPLDSEAVRTTSYNLMRIALRRLRGTQRLSYIFRQALLGERRAPGLVPVALSPVARRFGFLTDVGSAAVRGRADAFRGVFLGASP